MNDKELPARSSTKERNMTNLEAGCRTKLTNKTELEQVSNSSQVNRGITVDRQGSSVTHSPQKAKVIAIGSSTGGVDALKLVLDNFRASMPPVVIVQHTRNSDGGSLIRLLDKSCPTDVAPIRNETILHAGCVYVATGQTHVELVKRGNRCVARNVAGSPVSGHLPSVDVTFRSLAKMADACVGVLLTGMGRDGAEGLKEMHDAGAWTITQSQSSCLVYGMPRVAEELGASRSQMAPTEIGRFLSQITLAM